MSSTKETFANSLDRLIYPFIEAVASSANEADTGGRYLEWEDETSTYLVAHEPYKHTTTTVCVDGVLVYGRTHGRTEECRPGEWVISVFEKGKEILNAQMRQRLGEEVVNAANAATAFQPIGSLMGVDLCNPPGDN